MLDLARLKLENLGSYEHEILSRMWNAEAKLSGYGRVPEDGFIFYGQ
jgi:hypothetical protein